MSNIGKIIQAYDLDGEIIGLFRVIDNSCPEDYFETVIKEYFEMIDENEDNAYLFLSLKWGIERIYIDYEITI